ncbi:hypothetical protein LCGC14_1547540 [marine sediment metagenome]|uniref:Uncharacterized protein n=1 Tax=marine sediment metagenome TaxID=412755 RepID=A0A0F9IR98_9ZZZZ
MPTVKYEGKDIPVAPAQLILDSGLNVFALEMLVESLTKVPDVVPTAFAFEHRGTRIIVDRAPVC